MMIIIIVMMIILLIPIKVEALSLNYTDLSTLNTDLLSAAASRSDHLFIVTTQSPQSSP